MINGKTVLAIIPARGGSKGLPGKNIKPLAGKPLIAWTVEEAKKSKFIDRIIVSTDSQEIADVSLKYGAEVPFIRPVELSADNTPSSQVILHSLEWLSINEKIEYSIFILLQPTSPFRNNKHIDEAIEKFIGFPKAKSLVSICVASEHPAWIKKINAENFLESYEVWEKSISRRQELVQLYIVNGAIYIMYSEDFKNRERFDLSECTYYLMDEMSSIDIDNDLDLKFAEFLIKEKNI